MRFWTWYWFAHTAAMLVVMLAFPETFELDPNPTWGSGEP